VKLTRKDVHGIVPALLFCAILLCAELWPAHRQLIRMAFVAAVILYVSGTAAVAFRKLRRAFAEPYNYRSLNLSTEGFEYEDLSRRKWPVRWQDVSSVKFYRNEAAFEDLCGPYLETMWLIGTATGNRVKVMDESSNRGRLLEAFQKYLPTFDIDEAKRAVAATRDKGTWICFSKLPA
jgi:hypothetical protein